MQATGGMGATPHVVALLEVPYPLSGEVYPGFWVTQRCAQCQLLVSGGGGLLCCCGRMSNVWGWLWRSIGWRWRCVWLRWGTLWWSLPTCLHCRGAMVPLGTGNGGRVWWSRAGGCS